MLYYEYHLSTTQDGGIPLSAFPKDSASELAGFVFTLSFMPSAKQEAVNTNFLKSLVKQTTNYKLQYWTTQKQAKQFNDIMCT